MNYIIEINLMDGTIIIFTDLLKTVEDLIIKSSSTDMRK
jgi:hypothetical protein